MKKSLRRREDARKIRQQQMQILLVFICFATGIILTALTVAASVFIIYRILMIPALTDLRTGLYNTLLVPGESFIDVTALVVIVPVILCCLIWFYSRMTAKVIVRLLAR